jgi:hypothetical protein
VAADSKPARQLRGHHSRSNYTSSLPLLFPLHPHADYFNLDLSLALPHTLCTTTIASTSLILASTYAHSPSFFIFIYICTYCPCSFKRASTTLLTFYHLLPHATICRMRNTFLPLLFLLSLPLFFSSFGFFLSLRTCSCSFPTGSSSLCQYTSWTFNYLYPCLYIHTLHNSFAILL